MIKIIVADDHKLVRDGIRLALQGEKHIDLVSEAENGEDLIKITQQYIPDVILLDLNMPKVDGLSAMKQILSMHPETGFIVLSMYEDPGHLRECDKAGASSYLPKNVEKDELLRAIEKVAKGEKYYNPTMNQLLMQGLLEERKKKQEEIKITRREKEILECIAKGMSSKDMAEVLFLSQRTVESHRLRLLKKFKAKNATELLRTAIDKDLIHL